MPEKVLNLKDDKGLTFRILVQPRSSKNEIVGRHGDALKVKLTAPPVNGAANKACLAYLAKCLVLPKSSLEIVSGYSSRKKTIGVHLPNGGAGVVAERIRRLLHAP